jgi:tellurite resistance protein TerC
MPGQVEITAWHWAGFIICVLAFLALDLGVFHRRAHRVTFREALAWTGFWAALALLFAGALVWMRGKHEATQFVTGYLIELSLSMDNVFVIALVFSYFRVSAEQQHRVLFWGILGALLMRGLMIWAGVELIKRFEWLLYCFGAFIVLSGLKIMLRRGESGTPEKSIIVRVAKKLLPITNDFHGQNFTTQINGRRFFTPLFLALLAVETADLIFATDSIPAIFGVTRKSFIVFTSNVFAILGLRSLYFVLAGAMNLFRYLKAGISVVLVFIGIKMLIDPHGSNSPKWFQYDIPDAAALAVVGIIIAVSILASMIARNVEARRKSSISPDGQ